MAFDIFSFFKQYKSSLSVGGRLEKLLGSLPVAVTDQPYYQQSIKYTKVHEWELALDSLIELADIENGNIPDGFWTEMWLITAKIGSPTMRTICCKEIVLELKRSRKIPKSILKDKRIGSEIKDSAYRNIMFDNLRVARTKVSTSIFLNSDFKNSSAHKTSYVDCDFIQCKFYGRFGNLGDKTTYINCNFINCDITGVTMFEGPNFINCSFSGRIKNAIINNEAAHLWGGKCPIFENCDFKDAIFDNFNIYGSLGLNGSILPKNGILKFRNDNNELFLKIREMSAGIENDMMISIWALFSSKSGQNPIIFDELCLNSFFDTADAQQLFDSATDRFRIM